MKDTLPPVMGETGDLTCVESDEYNPYNGVAFTGKNVASSFSLAPLLQGYTYGVDKTYGYWLDVKFSVYVKNGADSDSNPFIAGFLPNTNLGTWGRVEIGSNIQRRTSATNPQTLSTSSAGFHDICINLFARRQANQKNADDKNTFWAYNTVEIDGQNSSVTSSSNVITLVTYPLGQNLYFYFPPEGEFYVSNIIVAVNSKLDATFPEVQNSTPLLRSQIYPVRLPLSAPTADSTFVAGADGQYVGTASGQKLVQTINTSELITKYGGTKHFIAEFSPKNPDNFLHDLEDAMTSFRTKAEREGMIFTPRVVLSPKVSGTVKEALFEMGVRLIERQ